MSRNRRVERISDMTLLARPAKPIDPGHERTSWPDGRASTRSTEGPPIWDVVESAHPDKSGTVTRRAE